MRRTGSRDPRERREASATSPFSIAVKTFSIRFGSRRIQRKSHQKTRSRTTAMAVMETSRIGHMIGPPLRKLSTNALPVGCACSPIAGAAGEGDAAATGGAVMAAVAAGDMPGIGDMPGMPAGGMPGAVGARDGAPGEAVVASIAGLIPGDAPKPAFASGVEAGGGVAWPNEVSASVREHRVAVSSVFIFDGKAGLPALLSDDIPRVIPNERSSSRAKLSQFCIPFLQASGSTHAFFRMLRLCGM